MTTSWNSSSEVRKHLPFLIIIYVEKAFNIREGLTRKDDTMPKRYLEEKIPDGPCKGQVLNLEPLLDQYYTARGWDVKKGLV
jgi:aldehyde:ferredoxin oxidoreductase